MITGPYAREQFARYLVAGVANTGITYLLLVVAMHWIAYLLAYTIVYAVGIALAYGLQSRFVFRVPIEWRAALRFPLAYAGQYAFGVVLLWLLVDVAHLAPNWAALVVVTATVPVGFLLSRRALMLRESASAR